MVSGHQPTVVRFPAIPNLECITNSLEEGIEELLSRAEVGYLCTIEDAAGIMETVEALSNRFPSKNQFLGKSEMGMTRPVVAER